MKIYNKLPSLQKETREFVFSLGAAYMLLPDAVDKEESTASFYF
jgi:hypothetical protein